MFFRPNFLECFCDSIETQGDVHFFQTEHCEKKKKEIRGYIDYQDILLFACTIITSTTCVSSVFYRVREIMLLARPLSQSNFNC